MDFEVTYTEEQQRFRREVRAWLEANVAASMLRLPVSAEDNYRRYLELRDLGRKLGAKGWLYPTAPAKYGGSGLDVDHAIISRKRSTASIFPYRPTTTAAGASARPRSWSGARRSSGKHSCPRSIGVRSGPGSS